MMRQHPRSLPSALLASLLLAACAHPAPVPAERAPNAAEAESGQHAKGHGAPAHEGHPEVQPSEGHPRAPHAHHRFEDAQRWAAQFEDPARDAWQKPEAVIEALALEPAHKVADIGSATGYFPMRLARRVPEGRVWGVDIEPDMVRFLNRRARESGLGNLYSILGTPEDPLLPESVDRVLMVDTYHHIEDRVVWLRGLSRYLAPGGKVVIVDFKKGELPVGPPDRSKLAAEAIRAEMEAAGYVTKSEDQGTLPYQYILVFEAAS